MRAGHDVVVLADPVLRPDVEAAGAEWRSWTEAPAKRSYSPDEDLARDWEARTPLGKFARFRDGIAFGPAAGYAHDVRAEIERRRPDVVVNPTVMFGAQAATEAAGVPQVILLTTVYVIPGTGAAPYGTGCAAPRNAVERARLARRPPVDAALVTGMRSLNATRAELGLPADHNPFEQARRAERFLVLTSRAFDVVPAGVPDNVRWVGPRLDDPAWAGAWTPPPGDDPLVLVGLSSTYMDQAGMLARIAAALGELPVRGLITLGPAMEGARVDTPPNVTVVPSAPHGEVLRHATAAIHHGGHGTTIKTLAAGVPAVVLPAGRDQPDSAARTVAAGAGVQLKPSAKPTAIARAARTVLDDGRYRAAAGRGRGHPRRHRTTSRWPSSRPSPTRARRAGRAARPRRARARRGARPSRAGTRRLTRETSRSSSTRRRSPAAAARIRSVASSLVDSGSVPVSTNVLPASGPSPGGGPSSSRTTPSERRSSISARISGSSSCSRIRPSPSGRSPASRGSTPYRRPAAHRSTGSAGRGCGR